MENRWPGDGGKEPGLGSGLALMLVMTICCAGVPLLLTAGGVGVLAGLFTDMWPAVLGGLALAVLGAILLRRRWKRQGKIGERVASNSPWRSRAGPPR